MKNALGVLSLVALLASSAALAGDLNPPLGVISPTMKDLQTVEPRTPISNATTPGDADSTFSITAPGSYYLTGNVVGASAKNGIKIAATGVTLDLNGFSLIGVPGSLDGVRVAIAVYGITIRNGVIRDWGSDGIDALTGSNVPIIVESVHARQNAVNGIGAGAASIIRQCLATNNTGDGIVAGHSSIVSSCQCTSNSGDGISSGPNATITHCTSVSSLEHGFNVNDNCTLTACTASSNQFNGIAATVGCTIMDCTTNSNALHGISASLGANVQRCTSFRNTQDGIRATTGAFIAHNNCYENGSGVASGAGVHTTGGDNRIDSNNVIGNDRGIDVDGAGSLIIRNSASANSTNYEFAANNRYGEVFNGLPAVTPAVSGSAAVSTLSTDPWANIAY
ncbi:MAG TPA: right-handed parallel beta-helix repeat-containing protein [Phycisphaerales bacterium]|nr:right-handed parallel beta-helix repeat-containing protein [Phycisphaerales bacterium]